MCSNYTSTVQPTTYRYRYYDPIHSLSSLHCYSFVYLVCATTIHENEVTGLIIK